LGMDRAAVSAEAAKRGLTVPGCTAGRATKGSAERASEAWSIQAISGVSRASARSARPGAGRSCGGCRPLWRSE
jgi:hypothetical protein